MMMLFTALVPAVAELARYANHDSQCAWKWSATNPRAACNCGFDEAISTVSNAQDALEQAISAANTCPHDTLVPLNQTATVLRCSDCTGTVSFLPSEEATDD